MSGPVTPPLEVTEVDGSPDGRPITKLIVSNGDLTISGRTATIDTSGSATSPGGADREIQWNDGGAFQGGDSGATCTIRATDAYIGGSALGGGYWGIASNDAANAGVQIKGIQTDGTTGANLYVENGDTRQGIMLQALGSGGGGADGPVYIGRGLITTSGASMPLTLTAADEEVRTSITIETGVNGGITMKAIGTGSYNFEQQSTDGDTLVKVLANGTGTPKVKLENGSMAVQTICEANKKFTIEGGNGGETFVFDVSSATGGITWPDGTEQITAASGGGGGISPLLGPPPSDTYDGSYYFFTGYQAGIGGIGPGQLWIADNPTYNAFVSPETGDLASISVNVLITGTGTSGAFGIYDDSDGLPNTLLGFATIDLSSTGIITQTSLSATISLTRGSRYWTAQTRSIGAGNAYITGVDDGNSIANAAPSLAVGSSFTDSGGANCFKTDGSVATTTLPATFIVADHVTDNRNRAVFGLKW